MRNLTPLLFLAAAMTLLPGCSRVVAQIPVETPKRSIELIVYSDDFALVQENRQVSLEKGTGRIGILDVSNAMDQDSVIYTWPNAKDAKVVSSTYELGTKDTGRLLQRFLGKPVELVYRSDNGQEGERQKGILQVAEPGNVVVKVGDKLVVNPNATVEVPANSGVVTIPQLSAEVESGTARQTHLGINYLTRGISWSADYNATLGADADSMALECWATVTNATGTEFPNAKLSFVAGSPNRSVSAKSKTAPMAETSRTDKEMNSSQDTFEASKPIAVGELYAYPYKSTATIRPDQTSRVRMMSSDVVTIKRDYAIRLPSIDSSSYYGNPTQRLTAALSLNFSNSKAAGLGSPLPGGALRVYEPGKDGAVTYIGAATITGTPTDAQVSATLSNVFDIYAQQRQVSATKVDKRTTARTVEVLIHNEKSHETEVRLVQEFYGKWKMATESHPSKPLNASSTQWKIKVPAGGEVKLSYKVLLSN